MKTRIVHTRFWEDEYISTLNPEGKLLFIYLLTNEKVNLTGIYEILDNRINSDTQIGFEVIHTLMHKFTVDKKIIRWRNWVRICNHDRYNTFSGSKNEIGKANELKRVPIEAIEGMDDTSIHTSMDTTLNININPNINNINTENTSIDTSIPVEEKVKTKKFVKPTLEEIKEYCAERENFVNPQQFFDHYESIGWMRGKNKMKDWKATVRTWENNNYDSGVKKNGAVSGNKSKYQGK